MFFTRRQSWVTIFAYDAWRILFLSKGWYNSAITRLYSATAWDIIYITKLKRTETRRLHALQKFSWRTENTPTSFHFTS
jgi:hypothetical protein